jgi:hypothetical protein
MNNAVSSIATRVKETPAEFGGGAAYSAIENILTNAVIPVAGMVLTFVAVYELIQMIISKNNMADIETWMFFKWIIKTVIAIYLISNTLVIINGFFDVVGEMIENAAEPVKSIEEINANIVDKVNSMESAGELLSLWAMTMVFRLLMTVMSIAVTLVIYGRMCEIYLTMSVAPIPMATVINSELGHMGKSYLKTIFALALQGFLMLVAALIYSALMQALVDPEAMLASGASLISVMGSYSALTVMLILTMFKSGGMAKAIIS